jgi:hypothetical protein
MLEVEWLEGKQLLSALHVALQTAPKPPPLVLDGNLKDSANAVVYSDGVSHTEEQFSGHVKSMGAVHGILILDYSPDTNHLNYAKIVLTNSKGSVTLGYGEDAMISQSDQLTKFITRYRFNVRSGTGAYAGASGAGVYTETADGGNIHTVGWVLPTVHLKLHTTRSR